MNLDHLPDFPQTAFLTELVRDLWADPTIRAVWLGGSLARGSGDAFSDVDLRVAVASADFGNGDLPASAQRLIEKRVGGLTMPFGKGMVMHHLLLHDGQIYDFLLQTTDHEPGAETRLILGCRDEDFGQRLAAALNTGPVTMFPPADGEALLQLLENLWIGQVKHLKVLHRGLTLLAWEGEHRMRQDLVRLWYAQATGCDCGPLNRLTIHTFSPVERAAREAASRDLLSLLGSPLRDIGEITAAARETQDEAARVGRLLSEQLKFSYPIAAEETARNCWLNFIR